MTDRHFLCLRPVHQCDCFGEPHTEAGHQAITTELVRLTLGGKPDRPELMTARESTTQAPRIRQAGVVHGGLSRVGDRWLRRWVVWVLSRNAVHPGPSQAWLDRNP